MALAQVPAPVPEYSVRSRQPGRKASAGTGYLSGGGVFHWQTNLPLLVSRGERRDRDAAGVPTNSVSQQKIDIVCQSCQQIHSCLFLNTLFSSLACCCLAIIECAALLCFSGPLCDHSIGFAINSFHRQFVHVPACTRFQRDIPLLHAKLADETQLNSCFQTRTEHNAVQFQVPLY